MTQMVDLEETSVGRIRLWHWIVLAILLVSPALALWRLAPRLNVPLAVGVWAGACLVTYGLYALDSARARAGDWQVPEAILHAAELAGGWPGAFLAQRRYRPRNATWRFQAVFWLIVAAHLYTVTDYQLGWRLARDGWQFVHPAAAHADKSRSRGRPRSALATGPAGLPGGADASRRSTIVNPDPLCRPRARSRQSTS